MELFSQALKRYIPNRNQKSNAKCYSPLGGFTDEIKFYFCNRMKIFILNLLLIQTTLLG